MGLPPRPYYTPTPRYCRISNGPQNNLERAISQEVLAERRRIDVIYFLNFSSLDRIAVKAVAIKFPF